MTQDQVDEFNKHSVALPIKGYENMRAIHIDTYKNIMDRETAISRLEGKAEGILQAERIVNETLKKIW